MRTVARTDTSLIGHWWWTVDRWSLSALALLILFGMLMIFAASPAVALRLDLNSYHFIQRHLAVVPLGMCVILITSLLSPENIRRIACLGLLLGLVLLVVTLLFGPEIKGARRRLSVYVLSLQASEFIKPCFIIISAWMLSEWQRSPGFPGHWISMFLYALIAGLFLLQPDLGQTIILSFVWFAQFYLAGLPTILVISFLGLGVIGLWSAYLLFDHVSSRVDRFINPAHGDTYQVDRSLEAFSNGGLLGTGPGEGRIKGLLPDAHADFVFSVAGEEFGALVAVAIVGLFGFLVLKGYVRLISETNFFILLSAAGLLTQFGLQAVIHMASSLHLIPAKGMTLPFISYGGSSFIAMSFGMGAVLALTRRRPGRGAIL